MSHTVERQEPTLRDWLVWLMDLVLSRAPYVFLICLILSMPPALPLIAMFQPPEWAWHLFLSVLGGSFVLTIVFMAMPWRGQESVRRRMPQRRAPNESAASADRR